MEAKTKTKQETLPTEQEVKTVKEEKMVIELPFDEKNPEPMEIIINGKKTIIARGVPTEVSKDVWYAIQQNNNQRISTIKMINAAVKQFAENENNK